MSFKVSTSEKPILSGMLLKRARKSGSNWKKRYFDLYSSKLVYREKAEGKVKGIMEFSEDYFVQDGPAPKGKFGFIVTDFENTHYLASETKDVKDFWCLAIATIIRKKLEAAKYFEDRKSIKLAAASAEISEDEQERQYQERLESYYKLVGRPEAKKNRKSMVDIRAAQVYAEAADANKLAGELKSEAEKHKHNKDKMAEFMKLLQEAEREQQRLEEEAKKMREIAEKASDSALVLSGVAEGKEEEEEEEEVEEKKPEAFVPFSKLNLDGHVEASAVEEASLRRRSVKLMAETKANAQEKQDGFQSPPLVFNAPTPKNTPIKKEEAAVEEKGIKGKLGLWQKKVTEHQEKQSTNVFSGAYQGGKEITQDQYGKPVEGSKTEARAKAAQDWVEQEIDKLIGVILSIGEEDKEEGGVKTVKFGPLFYHYSNISDSLVGILMRAKKRKRIKYQGDMLLQTYHDNVKITVLVA